MSQNSSSYQETKVWLAKLISGQSIGAIPEESLLLEVARQEGVIALCYEHLHQLPIWNDCSPTLRNALTQANLQEVAVEMARTEELRKVLALLAEHNIDILIMKGAALAHTLYSKPHHRSRCDTDLLLSSLKEAERASGLLQTTGYEQPTAVLGDLICPELGCYKTTASGLVHALDIHWGMSNSALFAYRYTFDQLYTTSNPISTLSSHSYGLNHVHALLLACMHRILNLWLKDIDRIIWVYDIHLLCISLNSQQWQTLTVTAKDKNLCGVVLEGLKEARILFATSIPEKNLTYLESATQKESFQPTHVGIAWRYHWATFCSFSSLKARALWLSQCLFPSVKYMRKKYKFKNKAYAPWFYGKRLLIGLLTK